MSLGPVLVGLLVWVGLLLAGLPAFLAAGIGAGVGVYVHRVPPGGGAGRDG